MKKEFVFVILALAFITSCSNQYNKSEICDNSKVYEDLNEALKIPNKVCALDISFSELKLIPADIGKLTDNPIDPKLINEIKVLLPNTEVII